jgi:hypothetical protein
MTDPKSRLYRKADGREAKLYFMGDVTMEAMSPWRPCHHGGHVTMENRHGLAVAGMVTKAGGTAERGAAQAMLKAKRKAVGRRITAGADKAYDAKDHVEILRM